MTMMGLTEYPELSAAGVNLFGMVNFLTFFQHTQPCMAERPFRSAVRSSLFAGPTSSTRRAE